MDTEPGKLIVSGSKLVRIVKRIWLLDLRCRMQTGPKEQLFEATAHASSSNEV